MLRMAAQTESTKYSSMNFLDDVLAVHLAQKADGIKRTLL
jgi:hypothetical protein